MKYNLDIVNQIPWNNQKNIGVYYNQAMARLKRNKDFCLFIDGDAVFTTDFWGKQLYDIAKKYNKCGCFTGVTNRIGCKWMLVEGVNWENNDMEYHRDIGKKLQENYYDNITDVTNVPPGEVMGGVCFMIKKSVWKKIGGFLETGALGIDNDLHWKLQKHNEKLYRMNGFYVYHWYRGGILANKAHLK